MSASNSPIYGTSADKWVLRDPDHPDDHGLEVVHSSGCPCDLPDAGDWHVFRWASRPDSWQQHHAPTDLLHEVPGVQALDLQPGDQLDCDDGMARWWFPSSNDQKLVRKDGCAAWWTTADLARRVTAVRRDGRVRTVAGGRWVCDHNDCDCTPTEVTDEMMNAAVAGYYSRTVFRGSLPDSLRDSLRRAVESALAAQNCGRGTTCPRCATGDHPNCLAVHGVLCCCDDAECYDRRKDAR